jgi:hypothetical protein
MYTFCDSNSNIVATKIKQHNGILMLTKIASL